jgi:lipopolysaccharide transport system permease protein
LDTIPEPRQQHTTLIQPQQNTLANALAELWYYRELVLYFVWRDVKVRYKQTVLGVSWAILKPLVQMVVFTFIFSNIAQLDSEGIPYPIFNYSALVPWLFFTSSLTGATSSLVSSASMIKKIYFPRLVLLVSATLSNLVDFSLSLLFLFVLMAWFGVSLSWKIVFLVPLLLLSILTSLGISLWLAPLNVQFRDVRLATPFLIQIGLYLTPIVYSSSSLPAPFDRLYALNPMAGVVEGFRWALVNTEVQPGIPSLMSVGIALLLFASGLMYFVRMEKTFADVI